jgi:hypothetical protein
MSRTIGMRRFEKMSPLPENGFNCQKPRGAGWHPVSRRQCSQLAGTPLRTPLIFYSRAKSVSNTGRVPMSSVYFAINGASRWAGMLGIRS